VVDEVRLNKQVIQLKFNNKKYDNIKHNENNYINAKIFKLLQSIILIKDKKKN